MAVNACKHGSNFQITIIAMKMSTVVEIESIEIESIRGNPKQHLAYEFQQNWSNSFS